MEENVKKEEGGGVCAHKLIHCIEQQELTQHCKATIL